MVDIIASYHRIQFEGKFMIQTQENDEKPHFGSYLRPLPQIRAANFLFFSLSLSVSRYHGQLSLCTISEKTNDPILRKCSDGWTDGQRDGRD